jgi:DNA polymerase-1
MLSNLSQFHYGSIKTLQVHDELLFEIKEEYAEKYKEIVKKEMQTALKLRVPIEANVEIDYSWRDVH